MDIETVNGLLLTQTLLQHTVFVSASVCASYSVSLVQTPGTGTGVLEASEVLFILDYVTRVFFYESLPMFNIIWFFLIVSVVWMKNCYFINLHFSSNF